MNSIILPHKQTMSVVNFLIQKIVNLYSKTKIQLANKLLIYVKALN